MKCYNCDFVFENINELKSCPKCGHKINIDEYNVDTTKVILDQIKTKSDFARLIGLFVINPIILILLSIVFFVGSLFYIYKAEAVTIQYLLLSISFLISVTFLYQQRNITKLYNDFLKNNNHYYILYPFKATNRVIANELTDKIITKDIIAQRYHCYESYEERYYTLHFNTYKLFHPQKLRLFLTKDKFNNKYLDANSNHLLKTYNDEDTNFVLIEGVVHGFLILDNYVITVYNTPKITKKYLFDTFSE